MVDPKDWDQFVTEQPHLSLDRLWMASTITLDMVLANPHFAAVLGPYAPHLFEEPINFDGTDDHLPIRLGELLLAFDRTYIGRPSMTELTEQELEVGTKALEYLTVFNRRVAREGVFDNFGWPALTRALGEEELADLFAISSGFSAGEPTPLLRLVP